MAAEQPARLVHDRILTHDRTASVAKREVLAKIRERWPQLPVVIMSGDTGSREGLEGAAQVMVKPLTLKRLEACLQRAVGSR